MVKLWCITAFTCEQHSGNVWTTHPLCTLLLFLVIWYPTPKNFLLMDIYGLRYYGWVKSISHEAKSITNVTNTVDTVAWDIMAILQIYAKESISKSNNHNAILEKDTSDFLTIQGYEVRPQEFVLHNKDNKDSASFTTKSISRKCFNIKWNLSIVIRLCPFVVPCPKHSNFKV